jgi:hypothetical protein
VAGEAGQSQRRTGEWRKPLPSDLPPDVSEAFGYLRRMIDEDGRAHFTIAREMAISSAAFSKMFGLPNGKIPPLQGVLRLFPVLDRDPGEFLEHWGHLWEKTAPDPGPGEGRRYRRPSRPILAGAAAGIVLLTLGLVYFLTRNTAPDPSRFDNTDPIATSCSSPPTDAVYYTHLYHDWPEQKKPPTEQLVEMHYSVQCRTVWAVLKKGTPGHTKVVLHRENDSRELSCIAGFDGECRTNQLNDANVLSHVTGSSGDAFGQTSSH